MKNKLSSLINPKTVALIGATERPGSVGAGLVENLWSGEKKRRLFWVNPNTDQIKGERTYSSVLKIKDDIDLAVIAVPAAIVPAVVDECCRKKVGAIIIISAGFAEIGAKGRKTQDEITAMVRRAGIPLIGPNCLGLIRPQIQLNASFAPLTPPAGEVAFISQSGALMNSVIDRSGLENYGFSSMISYGNGADLSLVDFLWLADQDQQTKAIAVYLEGLERGREFMEVASEISRRKPILVLKSGRTEQGQKAAASHTASLAGEDEIYQAAFKQSGVLAANTLEELFDLAKALAWQPRASGGVGVVTNGGGMGVLAADAASDLELDLPPLTEKTGNDLRKSGIMPATMATGNPLDIIGDADTERYRLAMGSVLAQKDINLLVVIQTKQTMTDIQKNMEAIVEMSAKYPRKAILSVCLPGHFSHQAIKWLEDHRIPNYSDPARALKAAWALSS